MSISAGFCTHELPVAPTSMARANQLLKALPVEDYRRLLPHLRQAVLQPRVTLQRCGQPIQEIVFPLSGVCSMVMTTDDGHSIELLGIGRDGVVGASVAWGQSESPADVVVQIGDTGAMSLPLDVFKSEMQRGTALAELISRYSRAAAVQLMQASACNALHSVEQRCSRWLLTTQVRVQSDNFPITQELLAMALGVRRPTVTLIMSDLYHDGVVTYSRGRMTIANRDALRARACECYAVLS
jgi:CRP-like cAMP-binding protein